MKINKVFLMVVATVVVLITFFILWMFHGGADQSKVIIEENVQKDNKVSSVQKNYSELSMSSNANSLINQNNKPIEHDMNNNVLVKDKDYANYSYNQETPVVVLGVNEANLPPEEKSELLRKFNNLNVYGSLSGGKITHEFKYTQKYKSELEKAGGYNKLEQQLAFKPTPLNNYIDNSLKLVGAVTSGTYTENKGFNSLFRTYDNGNGTKLEINEMYLNPENNMSVEVYKESINHYIGNYPATIERLKDENGTPITNLSWNTKDRNYMLTASNMNEVELDNLAKNIVNYNDNQIRKN